MENTREQFRLPDVGEGLTEAEIVRWLVHPGDSIGIDQPMVEIETAKATVELPSPSRGIVAQLHVDEGTTVPVGDVIITIDRAADATADLAARDRCQPAPAEHLASESTEAPGAGHGEAPGGFLVGYGPAADSPISRQRATRALAATTTPSARAAAPSREAPVRPLAKPPVRKLAKDLGVDIALLAGTGPDGRVTRQDVERHAAAGAAIPTSPTPRRQRTGERVSRVRVPGIHRHMAAAMVASAFTAPHATEFATVDVTATMTFRQRLSARRELRDLRLTPLVFVARALLHALRRTPEANCEWDDATGEIVMKHFVNLGIAVATDRGLIVPHVADADRLSLAELAGAIAELTETARSGKTSPAALSGGTITITNIGVFGVDTGTPILNPGQAAILAVGAIGRRPWVVDGPDGERIEPRWLANLALSFDHRVLDGRQASRLLVDVAEILTDPGLALL